MQIVAGVGVAVLVLALLFKPMFDDWDGFADCLYFWVKPDFMSWLDGEGFDDWWAEMKLGFWLTCGGGAGYCVFSLLS